MKHKGKYFFWAYIVVVVSLALAINHSGQNITVTAGSFSRNPGPGVPSSFSISALADRTADEPVPSDIDASADEPPPPEMKVYLTFDDGPSEHMERILDDLKQYDAVATFFLLEPPIRQYPELVQRAINEGHALGSHGVTHKYRTFYASTASMIKEIDAALTAIQEVGGIETTLVRVPYGSVPNISKPQMALLAERGYKIWDWNVDSNDWKTQDQRYVNTTIKQLEKLRALGTTPVILLHDMKGTAAHLSSLLKFLRENGYEFNVIDPTLPELQQGAKKRES